MLFAAKHFDPQLGIDAHSYLAPPGIWPTVHIGIVMDPADYLPTIQVSPDNPIVKGLGAVDSAVQSGLGLIGESTAAPAVPPPPGAEAGGEMPETIPFPLGATIEVGGVRRAQASTGGVDYHILVGAPMPIIKGPGGPQFEDELFMGSRIVLADGEPFSRITMPVLACNVVGMVPPFRKKKMVKPIRLSLMLPTTFNIAIPPRVFIGGPPTISWMGMIQKAFMKGLGKAYTRVARRVFRNMPPGFLKCTVLRAEPVDIRDGSVSVEHQDFEIPGRLPLTWLRSYSSRTQRLGVCGHGWDTPADIRLTFEADGSAIFLGPGMAALFPELPATEGAEHYALDIIDGVRLWREPQHWVVRTKDGLRYRFVASSAQQELVVDQIEDTCNNHWRFERRGGQLVRLVESGIEGLAGRTIEIVSRGGSIESMALRDPENGEMHPLVSYHFGSGELTAAVDPLGAARTFEYAEHHMVRHTDRVGLSFYYAYDMKWRVVHSWGDGGLYDYHFVYDDVLRQVAVTNSLGHKSVVKFDENQLPLCEIDALDGVTTFEYDEFGRTVGVTDPEALRTEFTYDARANLVSVRRADASAIKHEYDEEDLMVAIVDPSGSRWTQEADTRGLPVTQTDPLGFSTRFGHDEHGQLISRVNARGGRTLLRYDRHGQLKSLTDPLNQPQHFDNHVLGRRLAQIDPLGNASHFAYDTKGRLVRITLPDGGHIDCSYDAEDQLLQYKDEAGQMTRFEYVGIGKIGRRTLPDGHDIEYHYDTEEQLVALTNQRGERYQVLRDALGRIIEEVDYWRQPRRYSYDAAGRISQVTDPLGQIISYTTDKLGRVTRKTFPSAQQIGSQKQEEFVYDSGGRLIEIRNEDASIKRRFDAAGQLLEEIQNGFRISHAYDEVGNRIRRSTTAGNVVEYAFDLNDQLVGAAVAGHYPIEIKRDAMGRSTREQLSPTLVRYFQYSDRNLLEAQALHRNDLPLFDTRYDYDCAGNLLRRTDSAQGSDEYRYDRLGRMVQHTDSVDHVHTFLNDAAGDRLRTNVREVPVSQVVGAGDDASGTMWLREGEYDGIHYAFDRAGDLVYKASHQSGCASIELYWDANHRLVRSHTAGQTTFYAYDPLGRRVYKRTGQITTWFFWDDDVLLAEVQNDDTTIPTANSDQQALPGLVVKLSRRSQQAQVPKEIFSRAREYFYYPETSQPFGLIEPEFEGSNSGRRQVYHFHCDSNGTPTRLTDSEGNNVWSGTSVAWGGTLVSESIAMENPIRLPNQYFDVETGLIYNRYRYFDTDIGQFISQDPIGLDGGINIYEYAPNPIGYIDPLGLVHEKTQGYHVYGLYDVDANGNIAEKPYYVGITNDLRRRTDEHIESGRLTEGRETAMVPIAQNVTYGTARGIEQANIDYHGTRTGTVGVATSQANRGNKIASFDLKSKTRRKSRQRYFMRAYRRAMADLTRGCR